MSTAATLGKRQRAKKACIPCHQRKRKCDSHYPCSMCVTYEYTCTYHDPDKRPPSAANPPAASTTTSPIAAAAASPSTATTSPHKQTSVRVDHAATSSSAADQQGFRYAGSSAAMAFPHILSATLGSDHIPGQSSTSSLGYTFGIRPDEASNPLGWLGDLISEDDLAQNSNIYFSTMGRSFGDLFDPRIYTQRCRDYYRNRSYSTGALAFGAAAAGVAALGSYISGQRHPRETDLVQYAKAVLDDPASMRMPQIDHVAAWCLRVGYLRATTRPNNAWMASCTSMHLCEAVGLHQEENIVKMASVAGAAALGHDADRLRRIFWVTWACHTILSYEFDRSSVHFRSLTTDAILPISDSIAHQFVRLAQVIPAPNSPFQLASAPRTQTEELSARLKALHEIESTDPFMVVTRADIAFCFYRRAYQLKMGISDEFVQLVITSGNAAIEAGEQLARQGRLFWNVIGSVFHYACVLLAMDNLAASVHIAAAFKALETLVKAADTNHTREALHMAQHLLSLHLAKKRMELAQLEPVEASFQSSQAQQDSFVPPAMDASEFGYGLDWDQFLLEPYVTMFSGDVQLY